MTPTRSFVVATLLSIWAANSPGEDVGPPPRSSLGAKAAGSESEKLEPVLVNTQEVMRRIPNDYPPDALEKGIGGYVLVQFSLPDDGRPRQPVVVMSEPKGVFEGVALERLQIMQFTVPAAWVAKNQNRRHELVFMYYVWGEKLADVPAFRTEAIMTIGRKGKQ